VDGCFRPVEKISRYCVHHDAVNKRTGHPLGHTVLVGELQPYLRRTTRYVKQHRHHAAIAEAIRRCAEVVYGQRRRNLPARPNATAYERLSGWLDRLERAAVTPDVLLCIVAALFLYRETEPHAFKSDRHFRHQIAIRFIRKAPAPHSPLWRSGAGSKITVATRDMLADLLERSVGVLCLRMARTLSAAVNPYTPDQQAAINTPLPSSSSKKEL
jgi:hypothetical protein